MSILQDFHGNIIKLFKGENMGRKKFFETEFLMDLCTEYHNKFPYEKIKFSNLSNWVEKDKKISEVKSYTFSRNPKVKDYINYLNMIINSTENEYEKVLSGQYDLFWDLPKSKQFELLQSMTKAVKEVPLLKISMLNEQEKRNKRIESVNKEISKLKKEIKKISLQINYLKNIVDEELQLRIEIENHNITDKSIANLDNRIITAKNTLFDLSSIFEEYIYCLDEAEPNITKKENKPIDFFSLKKQ